MDAHKALITNIFNNSTLVEVPFFQRSYVWREDLWGRLLEDMEFVVKTKKPHFLGSIILKEGRKPRQGENFADCRTIVDGQQRLTTFLIFMKVLCLKLGQTALFDCQFRIMGQMIALKGQNKPGLLLCASGLYTLHDVLQKNDWNEHEIENRAEWLLANAQNIWKI